VEPVNPRIPKRTKTGRLQGPVAKGIIDTLENEPDKFVLKNQGVWLLAKKTAFVKEKGGGAILSVQFEDPELHGLVNGGHTFLAIQQVMSEQDHDGDPIGAWVRLHIMENVDPDDIMEMAEGLNRSIQVDDPSLEHLKGTFEKIKEALEGKRGANQVMYFQGDVGSIDVQTLLQYMSLLDLSRYPDRKAHPHRIFGRQKVALDLFRTDQAEDGEHVFDRIIPRLHEIMVLTDEIQKGFATYLAQLKITSAKQNDRVASAPHKKLAAHFAGGTLGGKIPLSWIFPALASLRANVDPEAWEKGKFQWRMDPVKLIEASMEEWAQIIRQEHQDSRGKIAEVGRREAAYRGCYSVVAVVLAENGYLG
jgi:hypothetical protein